MAGPLVAAIVGRAPTDKDTSAQALDNGTQKRRADNSGDGTQQHRGENVESEPLEQHPHAFTVDLEV